MVRRLRTTAINCSTIGDNTIITGVSGKRIVITSLVIVVGGETNLTLYDGTTALSGPMDLGASGEPRGFVSNHTEGGMILSTGNAFIINLSIGVQTSGFVTWYLD